LKEISKKAVDKIGQKKSVINGEKDICIILMFFQIIPVILIEICFLITFFMDSMVAVNECGFPLVSHHVIV
jgi:hypothetical protein